jgi:uncharacterized protein (DUF58 family)
MRKLVTTLATAAAGLALGAGVGVGVAVAGPDADTVRQPGMGAVHAEMMADAGGMHAGMGDMQAMHEAIGPKAMQAMQAMHDRMAAELPDDLRAQADQMHARMTEHMGSVDAGATDHTGHHRSDR